MSPVWREKVGEVLQAFVKWLRTTKWAPRIIGFMLNAGSTEEWLIFDTDKTYRGNYQKAYGREFRKYLTEKYGSDARLQKAWNDKKATLEKASPPVFMVRKGSHIWGPFSLRDPKLERQAIDYYRFLNETLADALIHFCRVTKEAAETPVICGGFHSYLWWETGIYSYIQEYGHTLIQRLNESPWVDFISDITSYDNRYAGGPSGYLSIPHSMNVHNKLHYTEVDLRTIKNMSPEHLKAWKKINPADIPVRTAEPAVPDRIWKWSYGYCGRATWASSRASCSASTCITSSPARRTGGLISAATSTRRPNWSRRSSTCPMSAKRPSTGTAAPSAKWRSCFRRKRRFTKPA